MAGYSLKPPKCNQKHKFYKHIKVYFFWLGSESGYCISDNREDHFFLSKEDNNEINSELKPVKNTGSMWSNKILELISEARVPPYPEDM